jgi:hypothetical protein
MRRAPAVAPGTEAGESRSDEDQVRRLVLALRKA